MIVEHRLPQAEALNRVQSLLGDVKTQFADKISDLEENWEGNQGRFSFNAMGFAVSGTLTVNNNTVVIDGKLPFAAGLLKGRIERIESTIKERADELLA